jgi:hypothetical protein
MSDPENLTVNMLRRIDRKLDALIENLSLRAKEKDSNQSSIAARSTAPLPACASKIAALTPRTEQ